MKDRLLDFLACPGCRGDLRLEDPVQADNFPWREIVGGKLVCQDCQENYPIKNGIPRMLTNNKKSLEVRETVDGFGYEWETYNHLIQDTYMSSRENFFDFIHPVTENYFENKTILDAGRFLKLGAHFGSREIIGLDLSGSVEAAYQNTSRLPNAHVVQGDILELPLKREFDYIFSIGVLQFLSEPEKGFRELTGLLKPGGRISIWVYSKENNGWVIRFLTPFREKFTSRLPRPALLFLSRALGLVYFLLLRLFYKPTNEWSVFKSIGFRLPYNDYFYYNLRLSYTDLSSVIFDHLVPQLVVYLSKEEVLEWFNNCHLKIVEVSSRNNMSWRAHGMM